MTCQHCEGRTTVVPLGCFHCGDPLPMRVADRLDVEAVRRRHQAHLGDPDYAPIQDWAAEAIGVLLGRVDELTQERIKLQDNWRGALDNGTALANQAARAEAALRVEREARQALQAAIEKLCDDAENRDGMSIHYRPVVLPSDLRRALAAAGVPTTEDGE